MLVKTTSNEYPVKGSEQAAGYDIKISRFLEQTENKVVIETDLDIELPSPDSIKTEKGNYLNFEYVAQVYPRSGISKHGWILGNCIGVIDADYRGTIKATFYKVSDNPFPYAENDRFAQLIFSLALKTSFVKVDKLSDTMRGIGGFGHTGNR